MNQLAIPSNSSAELSDEDINAWFTNFINNLKVDHLLLETHTASKEKRELYTALISNNEVKIYSDLRSASSMFFIKQILFEYLASLKNIIPDLLKLGLGISDSKILVWCEINDNDEDAEDALLLAEAKINSKYHTKGIFISSMIVEKSDGLQIPPHYQTVIN